MGSVLDELFEDVDAHVEKRLERTWQRGERGLQQLGQEQQRVAGDFMSQLARCSEHADGMEAENARLHSAIAGLVDQMRTFDAVIGGAVPPAPAHSPGALPGVASSDAPPVFSFAGVASSPLGPPLLERAATPLSLAHALGPLVPL